MNWQNKMWECRAADNNVYAYNTEIVASSQLRRLPTPSPQLLLLQIEYHLHVAWQSTDAAANKSCVLHNPHPAITDESEPLD